MLLWLSTPWPETGAHRSSDEVMIPATIPKTEDIVRERRERGCDLGASQRGLLRKKWGGGARVAMGGGRRARGGLCTGRDREGRSLGEVEEGVEMLTVEGIGPRWPE